jgi:hypothetical protein
MNPIIDHVGTNRWYNDLGQLHRIDGPAIIYTNGGKYWYHNGLRHRLDGPAAEVGYGPYKASHYYIHGNKLSKEEFKEITQSEEHLNWYLLKIL